MESSFARWRVATTFYRLAGNTSDTSKRAGDLGSEFGYVFGVQEADERALRATRFWSSGFGCWQNGFSAASLQEVFAPAGPSAARASHPSRTLS